MSGRDVQRNALPVLIDLLMKEKDGQVRLAVLDTVTALGPDAAPAVPALVQTLRTDYGGQGQEESHQDYRSALALAAIGKPAVEGLRGLLKERKENVRAEVDHGPGPDRARRGCGRPRPHPLARRQERTDPPRGRPRPRSDRHAAVDPLIAASTDKESDRPRACDRRPGKPVLDRDDRVNAAVLKGTHDVVAGGPGGGGDRRCRGLPLPDEVLLPALAENLSRDEEPIRLAAIDLLVERRSLLARMAPELDVPFDVE